MTKFVDSYEYILRENSIKNYITNSTKSQIKSDILKMIKEYNSCHKKYSINIDCEFPTDLLIRLMKPYLNLYLTAFYSLVPKNKIDAKYKLTRKLKEFQKFNPSFGRKIIVFKNKIKNGRVVRYKSHIDFKIEHKKFNVHTSENFMNNHLIYKYNDDNIDDNIDDDYDDDDNTDETDENTGETIAITSHHNMTNFNIFRLLIVENNRQITNENNENNYHGEDEESNEEENNETNEEENNLESDSNSELVEDYYDEIPDEDSIS
jgi:hypothetical protein